MKPYIFLDAGWTLVFPDLALFRRACSPRGYEFALERWERVMAEFGHHYDDGRRRGDDSWGLPYFLTWVLKRAGVARRDVPGIARELQGHDRARSLWSHAYPSVYATLTQLRTAGYRMSVISNADGRVREGFDRIGLSGYFEQIFDSQIVGYAKPDPRLFEHAMASMQVSAAQSLYVGDLYYVDVWGANRAGMAAVHLDRLGLYEDVPGVHLPSVAALPAFLEKGPDLKDERFFPLRNWQLES